MKLGDTALRAAELVSVQRLEDYGDPASTFNRAAQILDGIEQLTARKWTPERVVKVMIAVKLAREVGNHKSDNLVDLAGYTDILNYLEERLRQTILPELAIW